MRDLLSNLCSSIDGQNAPREGYELTVDNTVTSKPPTAGL
jgi:hypothetical protein